MCIRDEKLEGVYVAGDGKGVVIHIQPFSNPSTPPGFRIRSDIDRIRIKPLRTNRIRIRIQPLGTNRIRIQTPLS